MHSFPFHTFQQDFYKYFTILHSNPVFIAHNVRLPHEKESEDKTVPSAQQMFPVLQYTRVWTND